MTEEREQTIPEEIANSITHGVGALLAAACLTIAVVFSSLTPHHNVWNIVGMSIYGGTMFLLYLFSCLYHGINRPKTKAVMNYFDHSMIYLLIAGSYTAICLGGVRPYSPCWAWSVFGVEWLLAIGGIVFQCLCISKYRKLSNLSYLAMGWVLIIAAYPFYKALGLWPLFWIASGGLFYSIGILFYIRKDKKYMHAIWHLFVLAGTLTQYFAILFFIVLK